MKHRMIPDWLTQWEYAHRGLHGQGLPENSLSAAQAAIAAGLGIECDIQRSADGHAMVFHDWEFGRLTNGSGQTESHDAQDIEQLTFRGTDEHPMRLDTLLETVAGSVPILIEIKSKPGYDVERSCEAVRDSLANYAGPFAVMSFDPRVAPWFRENAPQITCGLVMREDEHGHTQTPDVRAMALHQANPDFLAYHVLALPSEPVSELRAKGLPILTWTVNSPETRANALLHADALISEGAGLA